PVPSTVTATVYIIVFASPWNIGFRTSTRPTGRGVTAKAVLEKNAQATSVARRRRGMGDLLSVGGLFDSARIVRWSADRSDLEQDALRVLDQLLHPHQEADRFPPVDDPVVVGQGHVHDRPELDPTFDAHRPLHDVVHPEDAGLRRIEDRR